MATEHEIIKIVLCDVTHNEAWLFTTEDCRDTKGYFGLILEVCSDAVGNFDVRMGHYDVNTEPCNIIQIAVVQVCTVTS